MNVKITKIKKLGNWQASFDNYDKINVRKFQQRPVVLQFLVFKIPTIMTF